MDTRQPGALKGRIWVADDFDAPLPENMLKRFSKDDLLPTGENRQVEGRMTEYSLSELLNQCNQSAPQSAFHTEWDGAHPIGKEISD